jgi:hypothetical protein
MFPFRSGQDVDKRLLYCKDIAEVLQKSLILSPELTQPVSIPLQESLYNIKCQGLNQVIVPVSKR